MKDWVIAVGVVCGTVLLLLFKHPLNNVEDVVSWLTMIGTVGTLIGTIFLATAEQRRRKREAMEVAELAAATIESTTRRMLARLNALRNEVRDLGLRHPQVYQTVVEELAAFPQWKADDLHPLSPLPNKCAFDLAQTAEMIRVALHIIPLSLRAGWLESEDKRRLLHENTQRILKDIIDPLQRASNECATAVEGAKARN